MEVFDWCALASSLWLGTLAWAVSAERGCRRLRAERDDARAYAALTIDEAAFYRDLLNAASSRESANLQRKGGP